jgi:hypothetical protein
LVCDHVHRPTADKRDIGRLAPQLESGARLRADALIFLITETYPALGDAEAHRQPAV